MAGDAKTSSWSEPVIPIPTTFMGAENLPPPNRNSPTSTAPRGADEKEIPIAPADAGPLSTRDYPVLLESVPPDEGGTYIRFTYAYAYGLQETKLLAASSHTWVRWNSAASLFTCARVILLTLRGLPSIET
jgi:hypothetical protein